MGSSLFGPQQRRKDDSPEDGCSLGRAFPELLPPPARGPFPSVLTDPGRPLYYPHSPDEKWKRSQKPPLWEGAEPGSKPGSSEISPLHFQTLQFAFKKLNVAGAKRAKTINGAITGDPGCVEPGGLLTWAHHQGDPMRDPKQLCGSTVSSRAHHC